MKKQRPNVLWLMSDQHNANCTSYAGNPNVQTPALDSIVADGVEFTQAFCNNPICSPSRISFITGQYPNHHRLLGNNHSMLQDHNPDTLACLFRRYGYQTALIGKSHLIRNWDQDGFEKIAYTDMCDADDNDPLTCHYFKYLVDLGLADQYGEGSPKPGQKTLDGSAPASLPYEHSIEHFTGEKSLEFLRERDSSRPFFLKMSFQRPHDPITPAPEDFNMVNPDDVVLPDSVVDLFENRFASKPKFMQDYITNSRAYPMVPSDRAKLQRALASYYALIMKIDYEIGRIIDFLKETDQYENTVVFYTADHGDFAGEHGLFLKNLGIYESIHRIPFILKWPGSPKGKKCDELVESVDWYSTLCDLCDVPVPEDRDGRSLLQLLDGKCPELQNVICEWDWAGGDRIIAVRSKTHRLVYYPAKQTGELYDRVSDPGELNNLWGKPEAKDAELTLLKIALDYFMDYRPDTDTANDGVLSQYNRYCFTPLVQKHRRYYSDLMATYTEPTAWPPQANK